MKTSLYNLNFYEAMREVIENGGAVKGDNFRNGIFLKMNAAGQLVIIDANDLYKEDIRVFVSGLVKQKFRRLSVMTLKELSR